MLFRDNRKVKCVIMNEMFKWNETIQKMPERCTCIKTEYCGSKPGINPYCSIHGDKDKTYKSFRQQLVECNKNGNLLHIDTSRLKGLYGYDVGTILVCVKHECICSSKVCMEERIVALK